MYRLNKKKYGDLIMLNKSDNGLKVCPDCENWIPQCAKYCPFCGRTLNKTGKEFSKKSIRVKF